MPRHAVRNYKDNAHVYCIASSSSKEAIVKIALNSGEGSNESIQKVDIFESSSSKILVIEPDPENHKNLFLISDDQQIYKLNTNVEGKATIIDTRDISHHELE